MTRMLAITLGVALALVGTVALGARNSSGTYTLSPSAPFVTGTAISSSTMNTRFSDVGTELTDSLSRSGKGGMLAPLRLTDGSVALPAYSFTNDTDTGFYRIGSGDVGLSLNGTQYFHASTVENVFAVQTYSNVSFGAPSHWGRGGGTVTFGTFDAYDAVFSTSGTERMRISATGDATFAGSVIVHTPVAATEVTNKAYVDQYVGLVTTVTTDLAALATHTCRADTIAESGSVSIPAGYDCVNATTAWTSGQYYSDWVSAVGTTITIRWCAGTVSGDADPPSTTYRLRCFKP